ncbi:MAG: chorismate mutase [Azoarcus sp.]|jgi:isochorismate pyruvate lyase|nr:chorismate mutase [Azoarcus sp.]
MSTDTDRAAGCVSHCRDMAEVRRGVDALDDAIVPLLARRAGFMTQAARIKHDETLVRDEARIAAIVARVRRIAERQGGNPDLIERLYRAMMEIYIDHEYQELARLRLTTPTP